MIEGSDTTCDCLVIGGGPAGLTAAMYLARFRRKARLIDAGFSRAAMIPRTHNFPGFPEGISGEELLARLRMQANQYGAVVERGWVDSLTAHPEGFAATVDGATIAARTVILTTGVQDNGTDLPDVRGATHAGNIRWCPVCDGYEIIDRRVALVASATNGPSHAAFLRTFTRDVTLFIEPPVGTSEVQAREQLAQGGIEVIATGVEQILPTGEGVGVRLTTGEQRQFDTLYPMLGHTPRSQLATPLGAKCDRSGDLEVDMHQQTSIPGLYAAGDLVRALNQMAVGMAHAATAATAVHNGLAPNPR